MYWKQGKSSCRTNNSRELGVRSLEASPDKGIRNKYFAIHILNICIAIILQVTEGAKIKRAAMQPLKNI